MTTRNNAALNLVIALLFWGSVVFGGYKLYQTWREFDSKDQHELAEKKTWVYGRVQHSVVGSSSFMAAVAQEFTGRKDVYVGACDWLASPMWEHSTKNPNWLSHVKGSTGMKVIGYCNIEGTADYVPEMRFEWEWEDGTGVIGISWGWVPEYLP